MFQWNNCFKKELNQITKIMLANGAYYIEEKDYFIIPNNHLELIPKELTKNFSDKRFWTSYATKPFIHFYTEDEYLKVKEKEVEKIKQEQKNFRKRIEAEKDIEVLKQEFGNKWRDNGWIKQNIGEYYIEEPMWQYFWTLIGNNWQVVDWKHNIKIEENMYNKIYSLKINGYNGSTFLSHVFKNNKGYSSKIIGAYKVNRQG